MSAARRPAHSFLVALLAAFALAASIGPLAAASPPYGYGWTNLDKRIRPPGVTNGAMAYDEARGELVLFPGFQEDGAHAGTWVRRDGVWQRVPNSSQPPARYAAGIAYDAARQEVVLFGGYGANSGQGPGGGALNDTWVWDGTRWTERQPTRAPSLRAFPAMAYDRERQQIVLFGGIGVNEAGQPFQKLGDTWVWDGTTWTRAEPPTAPEARHGAGMAFDEARGEIVMFSGEGAGGGGGTPCTWVMGVCVKAEVPGTDPPAAPEELNDTWTWDGQTWTRETPATSPPYRTVMGIAYDSVRDQTVIFGGADSRKFLGDTWVWDGQNWSERSPAQEPSPRMGPVMAFDRTVGMPIVFGGHRVTHSSAESWAWNGTTWTGLDAATPLGRVTPGLAHDPVRGVPLIFGGNGDTQMGDTWIYDDGWQQLSPATSPPIRSYHAVATDTSSKEILVFGGMDAEYKNLGDIWAWNGSTWQERTPELPSLSPPPRRSTAIAYDAARDEVVMFGGWNSDLDVFLSDTWTWDGSSWEPKIVTTSPPPLYEHMLAYDAARQEVVLYGGVTEAGERFGETWTWDGDGWTKEQPAQSPPATLGSGMVYDPTVGRVLLFTGNGQPGPGTVWAWDGTTWTQLQIPGPPHARLFPGMAFIPELGGSVLFGGSQKAGDDTWLLRVPPGAVGGTP